MIKAEIKHDEEGNGVCILNPDGTENGYDNAGNWIFNIDPNRKYEWRREYNGDGKLLSFSDSWGIKECYTYSDSGAIKTYWRKSPVMGEEWHEYDEAGNTLHYRDTDGIEWSQEYNSDGNVIYMRDVFGIERWYDESGEVSTNPFILGYVAE